MDQETRIRQLTERIEALKRENAFLKLNQPNGRSLDQEEERSEDPLLSPHAQQTLSNRDIERYSRQLLLSNGFGVKGQKKLSESTVLIIGAGGIGSTGMEDQQTRHGKFNDIVSQPSSSHSLNTSDSLSGCLWRWKSDNSRL